MTEDAVTYTAYPPNNTHVYTTTNRGIAKIWKHRDGLDVDPDPGDYEPGTIGHWRYMETDDK